MRPPELPPSAGDRPDEPQAGEPQAGQPQAGEPQAAEPQAGEPQAGAPEGDRPGRLRPSPRWRDADALLERTCWRCDKTAVPIQGRCPYCRAKVESALEERIILPVPKGVDPVMKVIWLFIGMVLVSLVQGLVLRAQAQ